MNQRSPLAALALSLLVGSAAIAEPTGLTYLGSLKIVDASWGFDEPSGLTLDPGANRVWAVSDDTKRLFRLTTKGEVDLTLKAGVKDLEGVARLPTGDFAAVREKSNEIVLVNGDGGGIVRRVKLSEMAGYDAVRTAFEDGPDGKGLEGIAAHPGGFYVVKEAEPRLLLDISADLGRIVSAHPLTAEAGFAAKGVSDKKLDVSGLAHDAGRERVWIVSDTGSAAFLYDPAARIVTARYRLARDSGKTLKNAEGVEVSADGAQLFVVTDDGERSVLAVYAIEG